MPVNVCSDEIAYASRSCLDRDKLILVLGAPRSGTTWMAKILDSHPRVLYRHEPDTVLKSTRIPKIVHQSEVHAYLERARHYLYQLAGVRTLKSAGSLPVFRKSFRSRAANAVLRAYVYGVRIADKAGFPTQQVRIPDLVDPGYGGPICLVIKSVGSLGRAGLFARALPQSRIILVMRDPFGQIASMIRGYHMSKFERALNTGHLLATEQARRYGLTPGRFQALRPVEQLAWHWAILNEKAI